MITYFCKITSNRKMGMVLLLLLLILPMAFGFGNLVKQDFYLGISELLVNADTGAGARIGIGVLGVVQAGVEAYIWGMVFTGGVGLAAGIVVGL